MRIEDIQRAVCKETNTYIGMMASRTRLREYLIPRHISVYLCYKAKERFGWTLGQIAEKHGLKNGKGKPDHSTVLAYQPSINDIIFKEKFKGGGVYSNTISKVEKELSI